MPLLSNPSFAAKTSLTYITTGALLDVWAGVWYSYLRRQGADEEVFTSVDALFTAVTAHDQRLLDQCANRLQTLSGAGKLPREASVYLEGIAARARAGKWQKSAEQLYSFMFAQRREGATPPPKPRGKLVAQRK